MIVSSLAALPAAASEQTGAAFLKMGVGARADGLNSAYTALANDPSALYWNPGGLASLSRQELLASRRSQFSDVNRFTHTLTNSISIQSILNNTHI